MAAVILLGSASGHTTVELTLLLSYSRRVPSDVWVGAITTLAGAVFGGGISFLVSWHQVREARRQREEDGEREQGRRSTDRRFRAYADFLTLARSFRNAMEAYCLRPGHQPSLTEIDSLLRSASNASALVFLVVESDTTFKACRSVVRALQEARAVIHDAGPIVGQEPWADMNALLGQATREFQNSARVELGVGGPTVAWESTALVGPEA